MFQSVDGNRGKIREKRRERRTRRGKEKNGWQSTRHTLGVLQFISDGCSPAREGANSHRKAVVNDGVSTVCSLFSVGSFLTLKLRNN